MRIPSLLAIGALLAACGPDRDPQTVRHAPPSDPDSIDTGTWLDDTDTGEPGPSDPDDPDDPDDPGDPDPDEPDDPDDPDPGTDPDVPPPSETCFLGQNRDHNECLDVVAPASMPSGYDYPAPLNGDVQYTAPARWLDLQAYDGALRLAPNFRLDEIAQLWKGRYAVIRPSAVANLQACRDEVGPLVVNSGYRSPSYNAGVGGVTWSRHMYGDAFDLNPLNASLTTLAAACNDNDAGYVALYTNHVHCDWRDEDLEYAFFDVPSSAMWRFSQVPQHDAELRAFGDLWTAEAEGFDEGEPLRQWVAFDAAGYVIETWTGETYLPPEGTAEVEVTVGGVITRRQPVVR